MTKSNTLIHLPSDGGSDLPVRSTHPWNANIAMMMLFESEKETLYAYV